MTEHQVRVPVPGSGLLAGYASQEERDRSLWLAERHQDLAHHGCLLPPWSALAGAERELAAAEARNWLRAAATGGMAGHLRPAVLAGNLDLPRAEIATFLDALDAAAGCQRGRAASCPDCDADPSDLCRGCEGRLHQAGSYDALAARIREASK